MRLTKQQRAALRGRFGGLCAYCGQPLGERWHADHVEPVGRKIKYVRGKGAVATGEYWRPENNRPDNLMPACAPCNIDKGPFLLEEWRQKLQRSTDVLRQHQSTYRHALRFGLVTETGASVLFHFEREGGA